MTAYYNEHDEGAAAVLRELIAQGHVAPGIVDTRSIEDVTPADLAGFTQVHFFAGIGVWSHALRRAGWPDARPVWTGSCRCQPFSAAGKSGGFADERHLWPAMFHLVAQCRPSAVFGEQVASKDGLGWFDLVSADLEGSGYAVGAADLCAAGAGVGWPESQAGEWLRRAIHDCPPAMVGPLRDFADWADGHLGAGGTHIRQRLYWFAADLRKLADPGCAFGIGRADAERPDATDPAERRQGAGYDKSCGDAGGLVHGIGARLEGYGGNGGDGHKPGRVGSVAAGSTAATGHNGGLADAGGAGSFPGTPPGVYRGEKGAGPRHEQLERSGDDDGRCPGAGDGGRGGADWLLCRDGKWRAVEPGTFPLDHASAARVVRLRGYGNALDAETATAFISAAAATLEGGAA